MGKMSRWTLLVLFPFLLKSQAKIVKYTLEAYYFTGAPDGIETDKILGLNGQFPGPTLEANIDDIFEITLTNSIQDGQNTSIHWHGMRQEGTLFEDGTNMISQCPLPSGQSMVYRFKAGQVGTFWYHSHFKSQYTGGMFGALVIHGTPEHYKYDGELTIILSDWYHQTMIQNEDWYLSSLSKGEPPYVNSGLINGHGRYPCNVTLFGNKTCNESTQFRPVFKVEQGKRYRIRLINTASVSVFHFSVDNHTISPIEVDGVDVKIPDDSIQLAPIAPAQRYSFLLSCLDKGRYLIRGELQKEMPVPNINKYPEAVMSDVTAILECVDEDLSHLKNRVEETTEPFSYKDVPPPNVVLHKDYLDEMKLAPLDGIPAPDYYDKEILLNVDFSEDQENVRRGSFNGTPFAIPTDKPLLMKMVDGEAIPDSVVPIRIDYGSVVQIVINNKPFGAHPFHLHGHHFWVLGLGEWRMGEFDKLKHNLTINGVKRDTVFVEEKSWAVIRFVADNPSVWLFHCHIDWHNLSGMALTFIEGEDIIRNKTVATEEANRVCRMHGINNN